MRKFIYDLIDFLKEHTERFKFIFFVFIIIYVIADYKIWLHDLDFWSIHDAGETPEPPDFLNYSFWEVFLGCGLIAVMFFSISKYFKKFEHIILKYLKSLFNLLGFLALVPFGLYLLIIILYSVLIGAKLAMMFVLTLIVSYFSARGVDKLWDWLES